MRAMRPAHHLSDQGDRVKPRVSYADLRWVQAFESVKKNGVAEGFKVIHLSDDPPWVQVKSKAGNRMVRKGDEFIHQLARK